MSQDQKDTNALIASWFHVGEEVHYMSRAIMDQKTVVLGFGRKYIPRGGSSHNLAGIYIDYNEIHLALNIVATAEKLKRPNFPSFSRDEWNAQIQSMRDLNIRISDLPDTPFWVGDMVGLLEKIPLFHWNEALRVDEIDYSNVHTGHVRYFVSGSNIRQYPINQEYLALVERGNVWKLEHGEPLSFPGDTEAKRMEEEAAFYKSLGMSSKVVYHPESQHERHTFGAALRVIEMNAADEMIYSEHKDADKEHCFLLIRYNVLKNDFAKRMREHTLKRWKA